MPKLTVHLDGSGNWGHAYVSITSSSGYQEFAGMWPKNASDTPYLIYGEATIRGNEPFKNPYYDASLPKLVLKEGKLVPNSDVNINEYLINGGV